MMVLTDLVSSSPVTADGFTLSVVLLVGAIVTLFIAMKNNLKRK